MRCTQCGQEIEASRSYCQYCGASADSPYKTNKPQNYQAAPQNYQAVPQNAYYYPNPQVNPAASESTLALVAFIFSIISTVSIGWLIVPLAWMIPMTIMTWQIYKGTRQTTTAFAVCSLLFVSLVSGILLLVDKSNNS